MWQMMICISALLFILVPEKHALHMFQQNRYELTRYTTWLKENLGSIFKENILILVSIVIVFALSFVPSMMIHYGISIICFLLFSISMILKEKKANYIKPLVYTGRVKRQIAVTLILVLLIDFICAKYVGRYLPALLMLIHYYGVWFIIYLMAIITTPIEKSVQNGFILDAKKILKSHQGLKVIGITGSYGKTSTKNVVRAVLSQKYNTLMTPSSFNTPMGITRTIREMLKPIHEVFVCEMGADKVGDITELMDFVHPQVGIVTSIGPQHLQTFHTQENIIREKMQMIEKLPQDGVGILNYDNEFIREYHINNPVKIITYGIHEEHVDYRAINIEYHPTGSTFTVIHEDEQIELSTKLLGELNILNILSAIACARYFGVSWNEIRKGVREMKQVEHRLELKKINGYTFIDDAFNANPSGAHMALSVLSSFPNKRYIVTPGMIDLGERQSEINYTFGKDMIDKVDYVILVGKEQTSPIYQGLVENGFAQDHILVVDHVKEAFTYIYTHASTLDTILLENDLPDAFSK